MVSNLTAHARRLRETLLGRRFELLTLAGLLTLVVYPYAGLLLGEASGLALRALVLFAAVHVVTTGRRVRWLAAALLVAAFLGMVQEASAWTRLLGISSELALYALTIAVAVPTVFHRMSAGRDALFGATAIYLLIGLFFAAVFELIETVAPGSFALSHSFSEQLLHDTMLYFSLVTLTTLGYGDITPAVDAVRSLVIVESVTGVLYSAVVIARLVGLYAIGETTAAFRPAGAAGPGGQRLEALFSVLLLQIVSYPYLPPEVWEGLGVLVLVVALYVLSTGRRRFAVGAALAAPALLFAVLPAGASPILALAEQISLPAFLFFLTGLLMVEIFRRQEVDRDTLFGACCIYLLLGFSWAGLYGLLVHLSPGALGASLGTATSDTELIYFSFVTLTTLGYGDFTPAINVAQSLATLQSLVGILFPAVLVARLVSLYGAEEESS